MSLWRSAACGSRLGVLLQDTARSVADRNLLIGQYLYALSWLKDGLGSGKTTATSCFADISLQATRELPGSAVEVSVRGPLVPCVCPSFQQYRAVAPRVAPISRRKSQRKAISLHSLCMQSAPGEPPTSRLSAQPPGLVPTDSFAFEVAHATSSVSTDPPWLASTGAGEPPSARPTTGEGSSTTKTALTEAQTAQRVARGVPPTAKAASSGAEAEAAGRLALAQAARRSAAEEAGWTRAELLNVPNAISVMRMLSAPVISYWIIDGNWPAALFGVAAAGRAFCLFL
jgi:hypothetical protein